MILKPDLHDAWRERMDRTSAESQRIMERFGIERPRCGFGANLGWYPTIERAFEKMFEAGWDGDLHQVKQKFCGLRIYIGVGLYDDVDNPVKRFFRTPIENLANKHEIWPKAGPGRFIGNIFQKIHILLWDITRLPFLRRHKQSKISDIVREAEAECDKLCEICGKERETKGFGWGMALCNECGLPNERRNDLT